MCVGDRRTDKQKLRERDRVREKEGRGERDGTQKTYF